VRVSQVLSAAVMGVNHGGQKGASPSEFGVGDANANCPPDSQKISLIIHQTCRFK